MAAFAHYNQLHLAEVNRTQGGHSGQRPLGKDSLQMVVTPDLPANLAPVLLWGAVPSHYSHLFRRC